MKVKQQLKKMLRSALVFAMVFALCGTTLAKAYATYFPVVVEHIWKDNGNTYGEGEEGAPTDGTGPRDAVGEVDFEFTNTSTDTKYEYNNEVKEGSISISNPKNDDASEENYESYEDENPVEPQETDDDVADDTDSVLESNVVSMDLNIDVNANPQAAASMLANDIAQQMDTVSNTSISEAQTDAVAAVLADAIVQNESSEEKPDYAYDPVNDVWTGTAGDTGSGYGHGAHKGNMYNDIKGALTEATKEALKENGYETELTITVKVGKITGVDTCGWVFDGYAGSYYKDLDSTSEPDKTYISTDGGETWIGEDGTTVDSDTLFTVWGSGEAGVGAGWSIRDCTFTFVHTRAASYGSSAPEDPDPEDPKPEDPKPEEPKPEEPKPEDPKPEDPKPEDPKPEDPSEEIPEPDVPLAEIPEEEPPVEELPEEVELEEPDVPLADIPQTGDISDLWYLAAALTASVILFLVIQERRNKKTA